MQAIEFETRIDEDGRVYMPKEFQYTYGKFARFVVLLPGQEKRGELSNRQARVAGLHQGAVRVSEDFDEPLPDEFWMGDR